MPISLRFITFTVTFLVVTSNLTGTREIKYADRTINSTFLDQLITFESESASAVLSESAASEIYSPLGLHFVLSMLNSLSEGDAKTAFAEALGMDLETLETQIPLLIDDLSRELNDFQLSNSIWYDNKNLTYDVSAFERVQPIYDAYLFEKDFASEGPEAFAAFISEQTKGFLHPNASAFELMRQTTFANLNTIYFHGLWNRKFEDTRILDFIDKDGLATSKEMMYKDEESMYFYENEKSKSIRMNYKDGSSMILIRPSESYGVDDVLGEPGALKEIIDQFFLSTSGIFPGMFNVALPAFSTSSMFNLIQHVRDLGLSSIFDLSTSNFAPMLNPGMPFAISFIAQQSLIEVDAEGTTAASATFSFGCSAAAPGPTTDFFLDKPFIYVIESATEIPMFIGTIRNVI